MQENNLSLSRRGHERYSVDAHAVLYLNASTKMSLKLKNISARGLCGLVSFPPETGREVEVMLLYPFFDEPVKRKAKIVWRNEINKSLWEIGLDFGEDNKIDLTNYSQRLK